MTQIEIIIDEDGTARFIYNEALDLSGIGETRIQRASHVEPTEDGRWTADLGPAGGPVLGPFDLRSEALGAEVDWLLENDLGTAAR